MFESLSRIRQGLSFARHPFLAPLAAGRGDSPAVLALAKRIKFSGWFDPPGTEKELPAAHSLAYRDLLPWDQATIKLSIAKFIREAFSSSLPSAGDVTVTIFGTCGREKAPQAEEYSDCITGFEFRGRQFAFLEPLVFTHGIGIELD